MSVPDQWRVRQFLKHSTAAFRYRYLQTALGEEDNEGVDFARERQAGLAQDHAARLVEQGYDPRPLIVVARRAARAAVDRELADGTAKIPD